MSSLRRDLPELGDRVSPTPEFLAKHRVVRPEVTQTKRRETWQLETRLYRLCHDRERVSNPGDAWIGTAEYDAANARWYGDWARANGAQNTVEVRAVEAKETDQQIDGEREAVHLGVQGDDECLHESRAGPFAPGLRGQVLVENPGCDHDHDGRQAPDA